jgi:hypothetical protein
MISFMGTALSRKALKPPIGASSNNRVALPTVTRSRKH